MSSPGLSDDKESVAGEWVDKVMVKKHDSENRDENPQLWEADSQELPNGFYQKYQPDPSKIYPELPSSRFSTNRKNNQDYDDLDDLEIATNDSSEADLQWQYNAPKSAKNAGSAKHKKSLAKNGKNVEIRSVKLQFI